MLIMEGLKELSLLEAVVGGLSDELLMLKWFDSKGDENKSPQQQGQCAARLLQVCNHAKALKKCKISQLFLHLSTEVSLV